MIRSGKARADWNGRFRRRRRITRSRRRRMSRGFSTRSRALVRVGRRRRRSDTAMNAVAQQFAQACDRAARAGRGHVRIRVRARAAVRDVLRMDRAEWPDRRRARAVESAAPAADREVTIQFLAQAANGMPWEFRPVDKELRVRLGAINTTRFYVRNRAGTAVTGQAVPSVAPGRAAPYLNKLECFCFSQPAPGRRRRDGDAGEVLRGAPTCRSRFARSRCRTRSSRWPGS